MEDNQTISLLKRFIKAQLKKQGLGYSDLADYLELSLPSVKKLMNNNDFKISRIESILSWLGFSLRETLEIIDNESFRKNQFTEEQESILNKNPLAMYILILLGSGFSLKYISTEKKISKKLLNECLLLLDKHSFIELHANNKVRILKNTPFHMIPNGPIAKKYKDAFLQNCKQQIGLSTNREILRSPFEIYMNDNLVKKFKNDLSELLENYLKLARIYIQSNDSTDLKPLTVLLFLNQNDTWRDVLKI